MNLEQPKILYTHKWYDPIGIGLTLLNDNVYSRIDSTRTKLEKLESALDEMNDMKDIFYKMVSIRANIGVWKTIAYEGQSVCDNAVLVYPNQKRSMGKWDETLLGKEKKEGFYLVMLSPESVEWLNELDFELGFTLID